MKVAVFGLGYVGTVSAACLADNGHDVVGVDPESTKVAMVAAGTARWWNPASGNWSRSPSPPGALRHRRSVGGHRRVRRRRPIDVIQTCNPPDIFWPIGLACRALDGTRFVSISTISAPRSTSPSSPRAPHSPSAACASWSG